MPSLNWIDCLLAAVVMLGIWRGWRAGFALGLVDLGCLAGALVLAWYATPLLAAQLVGMEWASEPWASPASFVIVFAGTQLLLGALVFPSLRGILTSRRAIAIDRALGILPGLVRGLLHALVMSIALAALPLTESITQTAQDSQAIAALAPPADWLEAKLGPYFDPMIEQTFGELTQPEEAGSQKSFTLPFSIPDAPDRPQLEAAMLRMENVERAQAGVRPLAADPVALGVARAHSRDMFARSYFSHQTPEGVSPFGRLRAAGIGFRVAGENLALARTLELAQEGLMKSPGHRANILNPMFTRVAIGIVDGGRRGLMVTQIFRN